MTVRRITPEQFAAMTPEQQQMYETAWESDFRRVMALEHTDHPRYLREASILFGTTPALMRKAARVQTFAPELMKPLRWGEMSMQNAWLEATRRMRRQERRAGRDD